MKNAKDRRAARRSNVVPALLVAVLVSGCTMQADDDSETSQDALEIADSRFGDRRFDEITWLTSHNAHVTVDGNWLVPNQTRSIAGQLEDGVRAFMIDVWSFKTPAWRCGLSLGSDCYPHGLYACHGQCDGVPGLAYALPRRRIADELGDIVRFLRATPKEVVTVFLEDYSSRDELRTEIEAVEGLRELLFDPRSWQVTTNGWPKVGAMIAANKRLLLLSDHGGKDDLGVGHGPSLTVENYWSIGQLGTNLECVTRWSNVPLDRQEPGFQRLFVMNHFRDAPAPPLAAFDNSAPMLRWRIFDRCIPAAQRKPNFVAVDFYETGDARQVVAEIDASWDGAP